jgi:hypothetical protein
LREGWGTLDIGHFSCAVELKHPERGIQQFRLEDKLLSQLRILQVAPSSPVPSQGEVVIDSYVRGDDLVAKYAQTPQRTARPEIYWRALREWRAQASDQAMGLELWLSVQTSLLASDPALSLRSVVEDVDEVFTAAGESGAWQPLGLASGASTGLDVGQNCFLFRLKSASISYCEMIFPADCDGVEFERTAQGVELRYRLFERSLEKGVIRRGRVRGCLVPRDRDFEFAGSCFADFCASPVPLTA